MRRTLVTVVLLCSAAVGLRASAGDFRPVSGSNAEGVVIPGEVAKKDVVGYMFTRFWTPTDQDIRELETRLPKFLRDGARLRSQDLDRREPVEVAKNLKTSARQYAGVFWRRRKCIFVNGFPSDEKVVDWRRRFVEVSDGGSAFWSVLYDVQRKSFDQLAANGPG